MPCDYPVPELSAALLSEGSQCEQGCEQYGFSLQGPLPSTGAPAVISFNIISVTVTCMKYQNLLGLNMLCKCSCRAGLFSGRLNVYASQEKRPKQNIRSQKKSARNFC